MRQALATLFLLFLIPAAVPQAAPPFYSGSAIRGLVVDAETHQALEGVYVVTQTILQTGLFHGEHVERLHVDETVTNARGEYFLPAWGPKARPIFSELDFGDPLLTYFKPGYKPESWANPLSPPNRDALRTSRWDGKTIVLSRFRGSPEEWARALRRLQERLAWGDEIGPLRRPNDYWRAMPKTVWAIEQARRALLEGTRHMMLDLSVWGITEAEIRADGQREGSGR
jgi:hypothetical protein